MSDIVERAKNWAADAKIAHVYGVSVRADLSTIGTVNELSAEVEWLRSAVARSLALAEQWEGDTTSVAQAFGKALRITISGPAREAEATE